MYIFVKSEDIFSAMVQHRRESYDEIENNVPTIRDDKILVRWQNIEVETTSAK